MFDTIRIYGEHDGTLDAAGRVTIPRRFHPLLDGEGYLTRSPSGPALLLCPCRYWEELSAQLHRPPTDLQARELHALLRFLAAGLPVRLDKQGRLTIPPRLRQYAGLDRAVILLAMGTHLEIWDRDTWDRYCAELDVQEMARGLAAPEAGRPRGTG